MGNPPATSRVRHVALTIAGVCLLPGIWLGLKYLCGVGDRYLPAPLDVLTAITDLEPSFFQHVTATTLRCVLGFLAGIGFGLFLGIAVNVNAALRSLLYPSIQSIRSTPAIAFVPFFLLWLGFSDIGRLLLVVTGIGFNIAIAADQILRDMPERYRVAFRSFHTDPSKLVLSFCLPFVLGEILPTLRFSLSTTIGVILVSEMLGSQVGLGYLIQTSRSTFSMHVIFLCAAVLGLLNVLLDQALVGLWKAAIQWK
jgi:ABC-type nitrate/sulfonate/bicarbonate transport system permease component